MVRIALKLMWSSLFATLIAGLSYATLAWHAATGQNSLGGSITGVIDDVAFEGDQYYIHGWACQEGNRGSIAINIYANHPAGGTPPGTYVMAGTADLDNEPAADRECHDANGGKHRFRTALPNQLLRTFQGKKIFVHGIALVGNVENAALAGSGKFAFPSPKWPPDPPTPNFLDGPRVAYGWTATTLRINGYCSGRRSNWIGWRHCVKSRRSLPVQAALIRNGVIALLNW
jgi:hypothetical protein